MNNYVHSVIPPCHVFIGCTNRSLAIPIAAMKDLPITQTRGTASLVKVNIITYILSLYDSFFDIVLSLFVMH